VLVAGGTDFFGGGSDPTLSSAEIYDPATGTWTTGASTKQLKFTYSTVGLIFTASGASLKNIKYAVIRTSSGAGAGKVLCFCTLSTAAFSITSPNTLTILPAATGVFTLA